MKIFSIFSCLLFSIFGALILPPLDFFYFLGHFFIVSLKAVLWISKGSFPSEIKSTMLDISDISEAILHQLYQFYSMFYYIVHWYPFLFIFFSIVSKCFKTITNAYNMFILYDYQLEIKQVTYQVNNFYILSM